MNKRSELFPSGTIQDLANEQDRHAGAMPTVIPFDHYIVSGADALEILHEIRGQQSGLYPFIAGDAYSVSRLVESFQLNSEAPGSSVTDIVEQSKTIDPAAWFTKPENEERNDALETDFEFPPRATLNEPTEPQSSLISHLDILSGKPHEQVFIGVAPLANESNWQIFANLQYGGWNDCPASAVHCAIHRYWATHFKTSVATVAYDTVEIFVDNPIKDQEVAKKVALEQYLYCNDLIDQGYERLDALAASLIEAKTWYFWWD